MSQGHKALAVKLFRCDEYSGARLVQFVAHVDKAYPFQSSAKTSLFDGDKWNNIDYLIGQEIKDTYDNDISKIFEALQKRAEEILSYGHKQP